MTKLNAVLSQDNGDWILKLAGDINFNASRSIWVIDIVKKVKQNQVESLIIDLGDLNNIDSRGLKFLYDIQEALSRQKVKVILKNPNAHMLRLFRIMQFDQSFIIDKRA
jgi:anti-anti-sigma factor